MSDPLQTPSPAAMVASLSFIFCFIFPVVCFCVGYVRFRYLVSRMPQDESSTIRELEGYSWDVIRIQQNVERFNNMYSLKKKKKTILRILKKYRMVSLLRWIITLRWLKLYHKEICFLIVDVLFPGLFLFV